MANPSQSIINPRYCAPNNITLEMVGKDGKFEVRESNGNIFFQVKKASLTMHKRRFLQDPDGNTIVTFSNKIKTIHDRWEVFSGDSTDSGHLVFSVKRSSLIQLTTKFDVFLANNRKEDVCDFMIQVDSSERSCVIYAGNSGESSTRVAQMQMHSTGHLWKKKDSYIVTINPNIDQAFIIALIVILDETDKSSSTGKAWSLSVNVDL